MKYLYVVCAAMLTVQCAQAGDPASSESRIAALEMLNTRMVHIIEHQTSLLEQCSQSIAQLKEEHAQDIKTLYETQCAILSRLKDVGIAPYRKPAKEMSLAELQHEIETSLKDYAQRPPSTVSIDDLRTSMMNQLRLAKLQTSPPLSSAPDHKGPFDADSNDDFDE